MTKKDLTALLVAFLGAWLMFQALLGLFGPIYTFLANVFVGFSDRGGVLSIAISSFQSLVYAAFAIILIRMSGRFAARLLHGAGIAGEEMIGGFSFTSVLPTMISLVGLYFIVTHLPQLVITALKWLALEAQAASTMSRLGGSDQFTTQYREALIYNGAVLAFAIFVFLRGDLLAALVEKCRKQPNQQSSQSTTPTVTPRAEQEARHP